MNKMRRISNLLNKFIYVVLGVTFFPVLACAIFLGREMNYNDILKMITLQPNWILFLIAVPVLFVTIYLIHWCNKYPLTRRGNFLANVILIISFTLVYFLSVRIAREIAFNLPWDISIVSSTASANVAERIPVGYFYYFSIYTNNIPITYILGELFHWAKYKLDYSLNPQFIWLQVNCILMAVGGLFSCFTIKRLIGNVMATLVTFFLNFFLIGLSAWKIAPYTDTYGLAFPVMCIYFYVCYRQVKPVWQRVLLIFLSIIFGGIGGLIKPNLFIVIIALFIAEFITFLSDAKRNWIYLLLNILLIFTMLFAVKSAKTYMMEAIGLDFNENIEAGIAEYFYMGLNEESTGSYDSGDYAVYGEFQFTDREERDAIVFERALKRIREKGFWGTLYFWLRKMVMTFNDGLFGWGVEVWIDSHYLPIVSTNTELTTFLREVYWNGPYVGAYNTTMQLVWIYCILGIPGMCIRTKSKRGQVILALCFLGIFFYQMLFEARARYLFAFLPLIIVCAVYGMHQYSLLMKNRLKRKNET